MTTHTSRGQAPGSRIFVVDVEASGPSPFSGVMTEFGIVDMETRQWFRGRLYDNHPNPENPAQPVPDGPNPQWTVGYSKFDLQQGFTRSGKDFKQVFEECTKWLEGLAQGQRIVLSSDNNSYDWSWVNYGFDEQGLPNPFGHSGRRIGDYFAGLMGNFKNTSRWKSSRDVPHTHASHDDAQGNVGALLLLLELQKRMNELYPNYKADAERIFKELCAEQKPQ